MLRRAREAKMLDKNSIEEVLVVLAKLWAVKVSGKWRLTEISKKLRTLFEKLKIAFSVEADLVIKKGGALDLFAAPDKSQERAGSLI